MRLASPTDFYNGCQYTAYRHHEGYAKRAALFASYPDPILIVGCGFGFLVDELLKLNKDAWGIDAEQWCIDNRVTDRVLKADILQPFSAHFSVAVTEDLLPCSDDDEALVVARNCAAIAPIVIHLVTEHGQAQELNYHSCVEWTRITQQLTVSLEGM